MLPSHLLAFARPSGGHPLIRSRFRSDALALGALAAGLLLWFLTLFVLRGFRYPVGPDGPVYLWWARLAAVEGVSTIERPGAAALLDALAAIGLGLPSVAAGV